MLDGWTVVRDTVHGALASDNESMERPDYSCRERMSRDGGPRGFSLVELLVVIAILAILAAIALPVYTEHVRKGRRSDAMAALSSVQQAQERWRANSASYADKLDTLGFSSASSPKGYYEISLSGVSAGGYTVMASTVSDKAQAADSKCAKMWVTLAGGNLVYGSTQPGCWAE